MFKMDSSMYISYVKYRQVNVANVVIRRNFKMGDDMFNITINCEIVNDLFYREGGEYFHVIENIGINEFLKKRGISDFVIKVE